MNVSFKIAGNGEMNGGGLENSGSSQDTTEVERDRKMTMKGEKGGAGSEEGASQDSGKGDGGASWSGEAAVPKINTSKREGREGERERGEGEGGGKEGVKGQHQVSTNSRLLSCMIISLTPFLD